MSQATPFCIWIDSPIWPVSTKICLFGFNAISRWFVLDLQLQRRKSRNSANKLVIGWILPILTLPVRCRSNKSICYGIWSRPPVYGNVNRYWPLCRSIEKRDGVEGSSCIKSAWARINGVHPTESARNVLIFVKHGWLIPQCQRWKLSKVLPVVVDQLCSWSQTSMLRTYEGC